MATASEQGAYSPQLSSHNIPLPALLRKNDHNEEFASGNSITGALSSTSKSTVDNSDQQPLSHSPPTKNQQGNNNNNKFGLGETSEKHQYAPTSPHLHSQPNRHHLTEDNRQSSAVDRTLDDLHIPTWITMIAASAVIRTTIQHPLNVAIARKRIMQDGASPTMRSVLLEAYRGASKKGDGQLHSAGTGGGGIRTVFRGYGTAVIGNIIGESSYLFTIEAIQSNFRKQHRHEIQDDMEKQNKPIKTITSGYYESNCGKVSDSVSPTLGDTTNSGYINSISKDILIGDFIAGVGGDVVALILCSPLSATVNRQMTAGYGLNKNGEYKGLFGTLRELWGQQYLQKHHSGIENGSSCRGVVQRFVGGISGLYVGVSAGIVMLPASGLWWGSYGMFKSILYDKVGPVLERIHNERKGEEENQQRLNELNAHYVNYENSSISSNITNGKGSSSNSIMGTIMNPLEAFKRDNWFISPTDNPLVNGTAGVAATTITTVMFSPVNVIRTRLQTLPPAPPPPSSTLSRSYLQGFYTRCGSGRVMTLCRDLIVKEGWRGFFKGSGVNVAAAMMDGLLFSTLYEMTKLGSDRGLLGAKMDKE